MKVELFVVADYATSHVGKLTIVGIFDTLYGQKIPIVYPSCSLAIKLRFDKIEEGSKKVCINLSDADGQNIVPRIEIPLKVQMMNDQYTCTKDIVANLKEIKFKSPGEYSFNLAIDGRHESSIPLFVRELPKKKSRRQ